VVNIPDPVALYELRPGPAGWEELRQAYEEALGQFEKKEFREAARGAGGFAAEAPNDGPSLILMHRTVACLVRTGELQPGVGAAGEVTPAGIAAV